MPPTPRIGIGLPVYNSDRFIAEAIESIRAQSFTDWELHIVDDASTDRSLEICNQYASLDDRIRVHRLHRNHGSGYATAQALSFVRADYLGFVDSDDFLEPDALALMIEWLESNPEYDVVYSDYVDISDRGRVLGLGARCSTPYSPHRLLTDFMVFHFRLMKTEKYWDVGEFDRSLLAAADYEFFLRASESLLIGHYPVPLYRHRKHDRAITSRLKEVQDGESRRAIQEAIERRGLNLRLSSPPNFKLEPIG